MCQQDSKSGLIRGEFSPSRRTWHVILMLLLFVSARAQDVDIFRGKCDGYKAGVGMTIIGVSMMATGVTKESIPEMRSKILDWSFIGIGFIMGVSGIVITNKHKSHVQLDGLKLTYKF